MECQEEPAEASPWAASSKAALGTAAARFGQPSAEEFALSYGYYWHVARLNQASVTLSNVYDAKLKSCMRALGMATLWTTTHSSPALTAASKYYAQSIQLTNASLATREGAVEHWTILTVVALSLYEVVTGCDVHSMEVWSKHVHGTAAPLELRRVEQMCTVEGRLIFLQAATSIVSNCLRKAIRLPPCIDILYEELFKRVDDADHTKWKVFSLRTNLVKLKSELVCGDPMSSREILEMAEDLDDAFEKVFVGIDTTGEPSYRGCDTDLDCDQAFSTGLHRNISIPSQMQIEVLTCRIQCQLAMLAAMHGDPSHLSLARARDRSSRSRWIIQKLQSWIVSAVSKEIFVSSMTLQSVGTIAKQLLFPTSSELWPAARVNERQVTNIATSDVPIFYTLRGSVLMWQLAFIGQIAEP